MLRPPRLFIATLLAGLLATLPVMAQTSHAGRWFEVEVIVFTQEGPGSGSSLPRLPALQKPAGLQFLRAAGPSGGTDPERDPFVLLPRAERTMNQHAARLDSTRGYRVLFHGAWRQPVLLRQDAQPIHLRGGSQIGDSDEFEGLLTPSVDFYLAAEVDLRLHEPGAAADLPVPSAFADDSEWHREAARAEPRIGRSESNLALTAKTMLALQEKRGRMRSTELHYFDHPRLGMLMRFDRYQPPPVSAPAPPPATPTPPAPASPR